MSTTNNTTDLPVPLMLALFFIVALLVYNITPRDQLKPTNPDEVAELVAYIKGEKKGSPPLSENSGGGGGEDQNGKSTGSEVEYKMEIPGKVEFSIEISFHSSTDASGKTSSYLVFHSTSLPGITVADAGLDGTVDWAHKELNGAVIIDHYRASMVDRTDPELLGVGVGEDYLAKWQKKYNELVKESLEYFHKNLTEAPYLHQETTQSLSEVYQEIESPEDFPPQSQK